MAGVLNSNLSPKSFLKNTTAPRISNLNYLDYSLLLLEKTINSLIHSAVKFQKTVTNSFLKINLSEFLSKKYLTPALILYFCLTLMPSISKSIDVVLSPKKINETEYRNESYTLDFKQENGDLVKMTINEFNKKIIPSGYFMHLSQNPYTFVPELYFYKIAKKDSLPKIYSDRKIEIIYVNRIAFFQKENYQAFSNYSQNRLLFQLESIAGSAKENWKKAFFFHGMFESPENIRKAYVRTVLYHETAHIMNPHTDIPENLPEPVKSGQVKKEYVLDELLAELQILSMGGMSSKLLLLRQESVLNKLEENDEHYLAAVWLIGEMLGLENSFDWNYKSSFTVWSKIHQLLKMDSDKLKAKAQKMLEIYFPNAKIIGSFRITDDEILWSGLDHALKKSDYASNLVQFLESLDLESEEQELVKTFSEIMNAPEKEEDYEFSQKQKNTFIRLLNKLLKDPDLPERLNRHRELFTFGNKTLYTDSYLKKNAGPSNLNLMAGAFFYFMTDMTTAKMEKIDQLLQQQEKEFPYESEAETEIILPLLFKNLSPSSKNFILKIQNQIEQGA